MSHTSSSSASVSRFQVATGYRIDTGYQIAGLSVSSVEASSPGEAAYLAAGKHAFTALNSESASVLVYWHGAKSYTAVATAGTRTVKFSFTVTAVICG